MGNNFWTKYGHVLDLDKAIFLIFDGTRLLEYFNKNLA